MSSKIKTLLIILFWILIWIFIALIANNNIIIPGPYEVLLSLIVSIIKINFWTTIGYSFLRIIAGFIIASVVGSALAYISYKNKLTKDILEPLIQFLKSAPIVCFIVLLLVWFGTDFIDLITVVIAVIPIFYFAIIEALNNRDINILNMLHVYKVKASVIWRVYDWPCIRPFFDQASKVGIGIAWKSAVTAQMIGLAINTIGEKVYASKLSLDSASLILWMIIVVALGWTCEKLIGLSIKSLTNKWKTNLNAIPKISNEKVINQEEPVNLKANNLSKKYSNTSIFKNINIDINPGDKLALNWGTAQGKTTLIKILLGIEKPSSGTINVNNCYPRTFSCAFQENTLLKNLNVEQNIIVVANKANKPFIIDHSLSINELSGGMKRCVEIERAITADSKIVVLDEPFAGLDEKTKNKAIRYINENLGNRALIISTHDSSDITKLGCKLITKNN